MMFLNKTKDWTFRSYTIPESKRKAGKTMRYTRVAFAGFNGNIGALYNTSSQSFGYDCGIALAAVI